MLQNGLSQKLKIYFHMYHIFKKEKKNKNKNKNKKQKKKKRKKERKNKPLFHRTLHFLDLMFTMK